MTFCPICASFPLRPSWRKLLRQAHSIRWVGASCFFIVAETVLPVYQDSLPRGYFAAAAGLAAIGSVLAQLKNQPEMQGGD